MGNMRNLIKEMLDDYFAAFTAEIGRPPRAVRTKEKVRPVIDAPIGCFGYWHPELASEDYSQADYEFLYGEKLPCDLYEYLRYWRFAQAELTYNGYLCCLNGLFEDENGKLFPPFSFVVKNQLYFKIGTTKHPESGAHYTIAVGDVGVCLSEDGTEDIYFLAHSVSEFLNGRMKNA